MESNETNLQETMRIIKMHTELYPKCEPDDIVKLLYQSEFGCGHFVRSREFAEAYLKSEYEACLLKTTPEAAAAHPLTDEIGGGFVRVHLEPLAQHGISLSTLADLFVRSSAIQPGSKSGMLQKLDLLKLLCEEGQTPFSPAELSAFLQKYVVAGCPAIHHSETYRRLYHPAYRVICSSFLTLLDDGAELKTDIFQKGE